MNNSPVRIIANYLPQFHPIPENDLWWGKGFTEWTNVGKAKPLFRGHYQPRVPADLGYYDLRLPEVREAQAELARSCGIEGFCYWHYWFGNGKQLLERPFNEVLESGKPDFPFCLGWANHSWADKQFSSEGKDKLLIEQLYPGEGDHLLHFKKTLPAFQDKRYIKVDGKPFFLIHSPFDMPDVKQLISNWQKWALENNFKGIHFVANTHKDEDVDPLLKLGFDAVNVVRMFHYLKQKYSLIHRAAIKFRRVVLKRGQFVDYQKVFKYFSSIKDEKEYLYPCIFPNWDHSPRSGKKSHNFFNSNPEAFQKHAEEVIRVVKNKQPEHRIIILKSWNEWAEGNYMEPDLKFRTGYIDALRKAVFS